MKTRHFRGGEKFGKTRHPNAAEVSKPFGELNRTVQEGLLMGFAFVQGG